MRFLLAMLVCFLSTLVHAQERDDAWATAYRQGPMTAAETRAFMKTLARYVFDNHLRRDQAPMRGMVYEYFDPKRKGQVDQFVQGEALDTMHDGAWLAAALVNAYRATGDPFYKDFLTEYLVPFYCKMLNESDVFFSPKKNDARAGAVVFNKEHALQPGEKGFVPYWWDDGGSVSLERRRDKKPLGPFACTDLLAGQDNPDHRLAGYSHGSSNHLAQDLGVMLQQCWLLLRSSQDEKDRKLAAQVALAAKHLHECRMRHHGHIPMCDAPAALANGDAALMKHVPDLSGPALWNPDNHYVRALYSFKPGVRYAFPGFADDQQYRYYQGLAKHGGTLPRPLAFRTVYDAFTEPKLYGFYCNHDTPSGTVFPPGINRFDLHPYYAKDGQLEDYRSERRGPSQKPRPIGSRMGPQNMICAGWALQLLKELPGLWDARGQKSFGKDVHVPLKEWRWVKIVGTDLEVAASPLGLALRGPTALRAIKVFDRPDGKGNAATVTIGGANSIRAENHKGEELHYDAMDFKGVPRFGIIIFFTVADKNQKPWANGIEHGRLSLEVAGKVHNLYLASPEADVKAWLERELGQGLRTWEAIFRHHGYIPTGLGAGDWDRFSDSGGYAHLISAASQWLFYLEGKKDWEQHAVPQVR